MEQQSTVDTNNEEAAMAAATAKRSSSLSFRDSIQQRLVNSWPAQLSPETPENLQRSLRVAGLDSSTTNTNQTKRPVFNGHYVPVAPTPLPDARLVIWSRSVACDLLGFTESQVTEDDDFLRFVAGESILSSTTTNTVLSWATPYALSIMGNRHTSNCPYGTGDGYGDGRAISIAELVQNKNNTDSWELQLKGAGTTPFHRGADGRAVLRSSIREFLASEAMHSLGVPTTRALSLVTSDTLQLHRPWYRDALDSSSSNDGDNRKDPFRPPRRQRLQDPVSMDDPRLAQYSDAQKRQLLQQWRRQQKADPDILQQEAAAITCRVSRSFTRVGHVDLFARRAERANFQRLQAAELVQNDDEDDDQAETRYYTDTNEWKELEQMVWHACYREFRDTAYTPFYSTNDIASAAETLLHESAQRLAAMVAHWIRVGFVQGNFNADNCLIGGYTMDYGPFGFVEEYDPVAAKWTGSGAHFGFLNQPTAGLANYGILVESVVPVIAAARGMNNHEALQDEFMQEAATVFQTAVDETMRLKLGFPRHAIEADKFWTQLEPLMRASRIDWTLLFRELTYLVRDVLVPNVMEHDNNGSSNAQETSLTTNSGNGEDLLHRLLHPENENHNPFYDAPSDELRKSWSQWLQQWSDALVSSQNNENSMNAVYERMRNTNPKYVLREWMLVEAYQRAARGDETELHALHELTLHPYEEGTATEQEDYYRRAPEEALQAGGTAFMS